jgi:flagellar motor switch protein FliN/FliY
VSGMNPELHDMNGDGNGASAETPVLEAEATIESVPGLREPVATEIALEPLAGVSGLAAGAETDLSLVLDVPVGLTVEMGRARMTIRETLAIATGSVITLNRLVGEPAELFANGRLIARGEVVAIDEEYGLRVTEVLSGGPGA